LLKDLGINTRRKQNVLAHLFLPTYPRDFHNLLEEFKKAQEKSKLQQSGMALDTVPGKTSAAGGFVLPVVIFLVIAVPLAAWLRAGTY
jgi:hypothetical protein